MSNIIFLHKKNDKNKFNEFSKKIISSGTRSYCLSKIKKDFLVESIESADYLFVNTFREQIRGFAAVYHDNYDGKHLHISLICNAKTHRMGTRKNKNIPKLAGKNIIDAVLKYGKKIKVKDVRLDAIKEVIPYYYNLGFRFENSQNNTETEKILVKELQNAYNNNNKPAQKKALEKIVLKFYKGYFNEKMQHDMGKDTDGRIKYAMDFGIPMKFVFKTTSICKGKSIKNPNRCRKYKTCKVVHGKKRSYCRTIKNTRKNQQRGGTKVELIPRHRITAEWKGKDRQIYTYPTDVYIPDSQDDVQGISSLEQFTETDSFEQLKEALEPGTTHLFVIEYVNRTKSVMRLGDQRHSHSQLSSDKGDNWILAAGEIRWDKGDNKLKISNQSGHYQPDSEDVKDVTIDFFARRIDIDFYKPFPNISESEPSQSQSPQSPLDMGDTEPDDGVYRVPKGGRRTRKNRK